MPLRRRDLVAGLALPCVRRSAAAVRDSVDLLLVLAADVSLSIDAAEARLQREGYCAALADPEVVAAACAGPAGAIGTAYVEWSGPREQWLIMPWTRIASPADAASWADRLRRQPRLPGDGTAIGAAIDHARAVLRAAPWSAARRVIDVSGDGANNAGPPVESARDRAVAEGITVNGLAIEGDNGLLLEGHGTRGSRHLLADYYRACVIGGDGAFVIAADGFDAFAEAIRRKLAREIAGGSGSRPDDAERPARDACGSGGAIVVSSAARYPGVIPAGT